MYRLYDYLPSGNGYKVRLLLTQLQIPFDYVELDIVEGETRTADYLTKNPNGKIPLLEVAPNQYLAESNAILMYLSEGTDYLPSDRWARSQVLQWMFFEQYSHEPNIATPRFWLNHLPSLNDYQKIALPYKQEQGYAALDVMEVHLGHHPFLVAERYTVADIALFAYTHVAPEGNFDLSRYPAIRRWIEQVQQQAGHISITQVPGKG
ncbi:glutathione S-transferase family protein [Pseudanabaena sp. FACHB-2040]|uniref:glutathione S-transferase family protein n=1 Tax=Pseudanabaena sp. FACHB-2040 TaxID=2692859 RepID=UPI001684E3B0|nr:glutathione S-transferase family protein [Pseudanabaena sp. FACHB-2040]MBD2259179.1 glutathione S-transferase family protein [Pseudanabaena sp. FACHB-2040]